jgi:hypothetical protein
VEPLWHAHDKDVIRPRGFDLDCSLVNSGADAILAHFDDLMLKLDASLERLSITAR